jgi:hypothetical protein
MEELAPSMPPVFGPVDIKFSRSDSNPDVLKYTVSSPIDLSRMEVIELEL